MFSLALKFSNKLQMSSTIVIEKYKNESSEMVHIWVYSNGSLLPWGQQETLRTEAHKQNNKIVVWGYSSDSEWAIVDVG